MDLEDPRLIRLQLRFQSQLLYLLTHLSFLSGAGDQGNNTFNKRSLLLEDPLWNRPDLQTVQVSLRTTKLEVSISFSTQKQIPRGFASSSKFCWCQGSCKALLTKAHTQPNRKSDRIQALSIWSVTENEPFGFFNSKDQRSSNAKLRNCLLSIDGFFLHFSCWVRVSLCCLAWLWTPRHKWSSCTSFPSYWDYRHISSCLAVDS